MDKVVYGVAASLLAYTVFGPRAQGADQAERDQQPAPLRAQATNIERLEDERNQLKKMLAEARTQAALSETSARKCKEETEKMTAQWSVMMNEKASLEMNLKNYRDERTKFQVKCDALLREKTSLEANLRTSNEEKTKMKTQWDAIISEKMNLDRNLKRCNEEKAKMQAQWDTIVNEKTNLDRNLKRCNEEKAKIQAQLDTSTSEKANLDRNLKRCNEEKARMQSQWDTIINEKTTLDRNLKRCNEEKAKIQAQLDTITSEKVTLDRNLKRCNEEKAKIQAQLDTITSEKVTLDRNLKRCNEEKAKTQAQWDEIINEKTTLDLNLKRCREEKAKMQTQWDTIVNENTALDTNVKKCREDKEKIELQLKIIVTEKSTVESELRKTQSLLANAEKLNRTLRAKCQGLEEENARLHSQNETQINQLNAVRQELKASEAALKDEIYKNQGKVANANVEKTALQLELASVKRGAAENSKTLETIASEKLLLQQQSAALITEKEQQNKEFIFLKNRLSRLTEESLANVRASEELQQCRQELETLKSRCWMAESEVKSFANERNSYLKNVSDMTERLKKAESALIKAKSEKESAMSKAAERDKRIANLEYSLETNRTQMNQLSELSTNKITSLQDRIKLKEIAIELLEQRDVSYHANISEKNSRIAELLSENQDLDKLLKESQSENYKSFKRISALETKISESRSTSDSFEQQLTAANAQLAELSSKCSAFEKENQALSQKIWKEHEKQRPECDKKSNRLWELQQQLAKSESEIKRLREQCKGKTRNPEKLAANESESASQSQKGEVLILCKHVGVCKVCQEYQAHIRRLKDEVKRLNDVILGSAEEFNAEIDNLQKMNDEKNGRILAMSKEVDDLRRSHGIRGEDESVAFRSKLSDLETKNTELRGKISKMSQMIEEFALQKQTLEQEVEKMYFDREALTNEIAHIRTKFMEANDTASDLSKKLKSINSEKFVLVKTNKSLHEQIASLQSARVAPIDVQRKPSDDRLTFAESNLEQISLKFEESEKIRMHQSAKIENLLLKFEHLKHENAFIKQNFDIATVWDCTQDLIHREMVATEEKIQQVRDSAYAYFQTLMREMMDGPQELVAERDFLVNRVRELEEINREITEDIRRSEVWRKEESRYVNRIGEMIHESENQRAKLKSLQIQLKEKEHEIEKLQQLDVVGDNSESQCVICETEEKNVVVLPCKHLCLGERCSELLGECPVCMTQIEDRMRIFCL